MDLIITILPVVTKDLPISPRFTPYDFVSRCKFSTLTTRQPMVEFYLLTFPRFPLQKKEHKSYFGKNQTHDFRTSRCAGYLLTRQRFAQLTKSVAGKPSACRQDSASPLFERFLQSRVLAGPAHMVTAQPNDVVTFLCWLDTGTAKESIHQNC